MWKILPPLFQNPMLFYISYSGTGDCGEICLTNFTKMWFSVLNNKEDFINLKANFNIKINDEVFVQHIVGLMKNPDNLCSAKILNEDNSSLTLELTSNYKYRLRLKVKFVQSDDTFFYNRVIQPMLHIIKDLNTSQKELCQLIESKDKEVNKYKDEGADIAFCYKTDPYNDEEFKRKYKSYEQFWGRTEISEDMLKRFYKHTENGKTVIKVADNNSHIHLIGHSSVNSAGEMLKKEFIVHSVELQNGGRTGSDVENGEIKTEVVPIKTEEQSASVVENRNNTAIKAESNIELGNGGNNSIELELPIKKEIKSESKNTRTNKRKKLNL